MDMSLWKESDKFLKTHPEIEERNRRESALRIKTETELIRKAYCLSKNAHKGQVDKAGRDYFLHPCVVAENVHTVNEKVVALLHDVVEDTEVSLQDLEDAGFPRVVVDAVDAITKRAGEAYDKYIERVKNNRIALIVKISDMQHNSDISRIKDPKEEDYERVKKYRTKIHELTAHLYSCL